MHGWRSLAVGVATALTVTLSVGAAPAEAATTWRRTTSALPLTAVAMNDHGLVAGTVGPAGSEKAATWKRGRLRVLPLPAGATRAAVVDVNNSGVVAGTAVVPGSGSHAVLWVAGVPRLLPEPGPLDPGDEEFLVQSQLTAINDRGDAVGVVDAGYGDRVTWWRGATSSSPQLAASGRWNPADLNDSGLTVGTGESISLASRWPEPGSQAYDLPALGTGEVVWSNATSVNAAGAIVGNQYAEGAAGMVQRPVRWTVGGRVLALPPVRVGVTTAEEVNDLGVVAGTVVLPRGRSEVVVWKRGRLQRTGITGETVDLDDSGRVLVRDGSRSFVVAPVG